MTCLVKFYSTSDSCVCYLLGGAPTTESPEPFRSGNLPEGFHKRLMLHQHIEKDQYYYIKWWLFKVKKFLCSGTCTRPLLMKNKKQRTYHICLEHWYLHLVVLLGWSNSLPQHQLCQWHRILGNLPHPHCIWHSFFVLLKLQLFHTLIKRQTKKNHDMQ